ncbi:3-phenylpropionate/trans-cinnamate dioxygenase ferredoxin subunit [Belliella buryatensis]|uniref:3-phenylpropionate/trans-cinnamate dioxygenase ferredoxin subunit n=1 Tax=Belliella buryatensis TaxID=1500549 RepID=A0A239DF33_9BACT|nr:Rieske 2Fe-2S domain-containing protein [Belliella buryatensis]SNS30682.1 3-phenylpropionate/trans-cinnamate dioxygenase ferredoxin subunit [Belliella buryatensis]
MKTFTLGQSKKEAVGMIPNKQIKLLQVGGQRICISRINESFYAFEQHCPHRKASLHQGMITDFEEVVCPLHEYRFHMKSGEVKAGSCGTLETYSIKLTDSGLEIEMP